MDRPHALFSQICIMLHILHIIPNGYPDNNRWQLQAIGDVWWKYIQLTVNSNTECKQTNMYLLYEYNGSIDSITSLLQQEHIHMKSKIVTNLSNILRGFCINSSHFHITLSRRRFQQNTTVAKNHLKQSIHTKTPSVIRNMKKFLLNFPWTSEVMFGNLLAFKLYTKRNLFKNLSPSCININLQMWQNLSEEREHLMVLMFTRA